MAIHSEVVGESRGSGEFPILKVSKYSGMVVLFTNYTEGIIVFEGGGEPVGTYSNMWIYSSCKSTWETFDGTIKLRNNFNE